MRVILHPGFHKTATSSLQACLAANRDLLAPYCRIALEAELPLRAATRYAVSRDPFDLASFTASFAEFCAAIKEGGHQTLLISSEGLSGRTPGKKGIKTYSAAIDLACAMADAIRAVFGRKADLTLLYTTRAPEAWLSSAWRHNLFGYRVTEDFATFRQTYAESADFAAILDKIAARLPKARIIAAALETTTLSGGHPADAVLSLLDLPATLRADLRYPAARNVGWDDQRSAQLLALNRSDLDDASLRAAKQALRRTAAD